MSNIGKSLPTIETLQERAKGFSVNAYNVDYIQRALQWIHATEIDDIIGMRSVIEIWHPDGYTIGWLFYDVNQEQWVFVYATNEEQW